jgi:hypothetical protein
MQIRMNNLHPKVANFFTIARAIIMNFTETDEENASEIAYKNMRRYFVSDFHIENQEEIQEENSNLTKINL